jgi:hypothetical protein
MVSLSPFHLRDLDRCGKINAHFLFGIQSCHPLNSIPSRSSMKISLVPVVVAALLSTVCSVDGHSLQPLVTVVCDPEDNACSAMPALPVVPKTANHQLSISVDSAAYATSQRLAAIADTRELITNGPRTITLAGESYPFYWGPRAEPDSLTLTTRLEENRVLEAFKPTIGPMLMDTATNLSEQLTSLESIAAIYDHASSTVEKPMSADNSDELFGLQRTTIKSFQLREATPQDLNGSALALSDWQMIQHCGLSAAALELTHALFVESYPDVGKYNDPQQPQKYVPNVVGFFCVHADTGGLMPIEIRLLDTGLAYTPLDSQDEWTLAKMALETASVAFHQVGHVAWTHAVTVPLRVEAMRTMSKQHPVLALLRRHVFADFGLESRFETLEESPAVLDETYGWGATGSSMFLWDQTQLGLSMKGQAFAHDIEQRGLHHIPDHKYVTYGAMYNTAFADFVRAYVDVYYASDAAVHADVELQHWAKASNTIPHIKDFPVAFEAKDKLVELLTHVVFTSTVRHHAVNGAATWHGLSVPYSSMALWKPLPTAKLTSDQKLGLREYTAPTPLIPLVLAFEASFLRRVPISESMFSAYTVEPFASEPLLQPAIRAFQAALETMDEIMVSREAHAVRPYLLLRPKDLPHYIWV